MHDFLDRGKTTSAAYHTAFACHTASVYIAR